MKFRRIIELIDIVMTITAFILLLSVCCIKTEKTPVHGPHIARTMQQVEYYQAQGLRCHPEFWPEHVVFRCDD